MGRYSSPNHPQMYHTDVVYCIFPIAAVRLCGLNFSPTTPPTTLRRVRGLRSRSSAALTCFSRQSAKRSTRHPTSQVSGSELRGAAEEIRVPLVVLKPQFSKLSGTARKFLVQIVFEFQQFINRFPLPADPWTVQARLEASLEVSLVFRWKPELFMIGDVPFISREMHGREIVI